MGRLISSLLLYLEYVGDAVAPAALDRSMVADAFAYLEVVEPSVVSLDSLLAYVEYAGDAVIPATLDTATANDVFAYVEFTEGDVIPEEPPALAYGPVAYVI
jgi:hypothetical protein